MFSLGIRQLEHASGKPSADVRLAAEIKAKVQEATKILGLDPSDTTDKELYGALLGRIKEDDQLLRRAIGVADQATTGDVFTAVVKAVDQLAVPRTCWAIKYSTVKKLLKQHPPKSLMKQLGYKSLDSMLKRENTALLCAGIRFTESDEWFRNLTKLYKGLTPLDFETRPVKLLVLDNKKLETAAFRFLHAQRHNVVHLKEVGVIAILPVPVPELPGICTALLTHVLHVLSEIRLYSAYFKLHQVAPRFGEMVARTLQDLQDTVVTIAGQQVSWKVVHRYFGDPNRQSYPELFEPHLQPEDLHWRRAEDMLRQIEPRLAFWQGLDYVGSVHNSGRPVSLNLMDVTINYCNGLVFGQHTAHHLREALWNEIFARYLGQERLEHEILHQLEQGVGARGWLGGAITAGS